MTAHPQYWKVRAFLNARGEAQARAQQAIHIAKMADAKAKQADADLFETMTAAGLDPKANYRFDDATETIVVASND